MHLCPFIAVHYSCCLFQWNRKSHYRWHQENFFVGKSLDILISPVLKVFFLLSFFFWKTTAMADLSTLLGKELKFISCVLEWKLQTCGSKYDNRVVYMKQMLFCRQTASLESSAWKDYWVYHVVWTYELFNGIHFPLAKYLWIMMPNHCACHMLRGCQPVIKV